MPTEKELMLKQADAETTYQKKLTAGTNITIDPVTNIISSAGGGSTVQYTDNVPSGEAVGILAINGQSHPIHIPRLAEGSGITISKNITTNVYTISLSGGGGGTTKTYMGETNPDELVGEDGDLYFKYHKIETDIPTELTLPSLPDEATVPFPITNFNSYDSFTFYYTDGNNEPHNRKINIGDLVISDSPADESPNSNIYTWNSYRYVQATRSTNGEGLVLRVCGNCLYKLEANVTEVDLGIDKSYAKVEDTWLPSGEQVEANPEETSQTPLTKIKIDGITYYIAAGGSAEIVPLTRAEWDALPASKYTDDILYLITDSFTTDTIITPNPEGEATDTLTKLQIDETIYDLAGESGAAAIEKTQAEYDALTPAQKTNGAIYMVSPDEDTIDDVHKIYYMGTEYANTNGGSGGGAGYSETVLFEESGSTYAGIKELSDNISEYDELIFRSIYKNSQTTYEQRVLTSLIEEIGYIQNPTSSSNHISLEFGYDQSFYRMVRGENDNELNIFQVSGTRHVITIIGVKYEGSAGGGGSEGEGVEIYSEDEYIVGSLNINGVKKKIYQKTFVLNNITVTQSSGYSYDITSLGIEDVVESPRGFVKITNSDRRSIPFNLLSGYGFTATVKPNQILFERAGNDITISQAVVTIRYTKTVETDAPAWGGSVNNYYASFIDTDNVIDSGVYNPTAPLSYTATEDCFVVIALIANNNPCIVSVDNKEIYRIYDNGIGSITVPVPIKKGQTITATTSYSAEDSPYTIYGITYGSGGSSSESSVHYSTTEQVIGTWIDGKPLYQKTYENLNIGTVQNYTLTLSDLQDIEYFRVVPEGSQVSVSVPFPYIHYGTENLVGYFIGITNGVPSLEIRKGSEAASLSNLQFLTIQYTKTTD